MQQSNVGLDDLRAMTEPSSSRSWSWSDASQDLLQLILKFLTPLNHLRFGSVCRSWRIAQRECLHLPAQDLPFHIVCRDNNNDKQRESIELYSFSEKKIYKKSVHRPFAFAYSIPYSRGWLVLYDTDDKIDFLFNPFIANGCIDLPEQERKCYDKCFFCSTPAHPDGVLLLKSSLNKRFLPCLLNPRSDHQYYEWQEPFIVSDCDQRTSSVTSSFIFFQGKLYALNNDCSLSVVDTFFPHNFTILRMKLECTVDSAPPVEWHHHAVIVESCGEIWLVLRVGEFWNRTVAVFRANLTELEWVNVENLGDRALLLLPTSSFSICTIGTDFRSNWVYYFSYFSQRRVLVRYIEFELGGDGVPLFEGPTDDEYNTDDRYGVTDDENSVTDDDEHGVTDDQHRVTDDDEHGHVTDDDEHGVTDDQHSVTDDDEHGHVTDDQHSVTDDDEHGHVTDDEYSVTGDDEHGVTGDEYNVTDDDEHGVADDEYSVTDDDEHGVTDDEYSVTDDDEHGVTDDEHGVTGDEYNVTGDDEHGVTGDEYNVTDDDEHGVTHDEYSVIDDDEHGVTDDDEHGVPAYINFLRVLILLLLILCSLIVIHTLS